MTEQRLSPQEARAFLVAIANRAVSGGVGMPWLTIDREEQEPKAQDEEQNDQVMPRS